MYTYIVYLIARRVFICDFNHSLTPTFMNIIRAICRPQTTSKIYTNKYIFKDIRSYWIVTKNGIDFWTSYTMNMTDVSKECATAIGFTFQNVWKRHVHAFSNVQKLYRLPPKHQWICTRHRESCEIKGKSIYPSKEIEGMKEWMNNRRGGREGDSSRANN